MISRFTVAVAIAVIGLTLNSGIPLNGQEQDSETPSLESVAKSFDSDLEAELQKLTALRQQIAEEKPTLAREMNETAATLREKQRSYDIARSTREAISDEFEKAEKQLKVWRDERTYIDGLLLDLRRNLEAQSSLARVEAQKELLKQASSEGDDGTTARLDLLDAAIRRIAESGKAESYTGSALDSEGVLQKGTFAEAGPVSWFTPLSGNDAGLIASTPDLVPELIPDTADPDEIQKLIDGKPGSPSFDPTLGTAIALDHADPTIIEHIRQGGLWIFPILFLALIALIAAIGKWIQLFRIRDLKSGVVQKVIDAVSGGSKEEAQGIIDAIQHPARHILAEGIKSSGLESDDLEEALYAKYMEALPPLQKGLPFIAIASATAPLLGLLGTVTGMIHTFQRITIFGTGDTKSLTSGISEALVTTEVGLIVAIPALIAHALLQRKVQGIRSTMEMTSVAFINGVKSRK